MGFYHQIDRAFRLNIFPSSNSMGVGSCSPMASHGYLQELHTFLDGTRLRRALTGLEVGAMCLLPGGWGCGDFMARQYISFATGRTRFAPGLHLIPSGKLT